MTCMYVCMYVYIFKHHIIIIIVQMGTENANNNIYYNIIYIIVIWIIRIAWAPTCGRRAILRNPRCESERDWFACTRPLHIGYTLMAKRVVLSCKLEHSTWLPTKDCSIIPCPSHMIHIHGTYDSCPVAWHGTKFPDQFTGAAQRSGAAG